MTAPLTVLNEGPHHLVVDKPADTLVVRGRGQQKETLLDLVEAQLGKKAYPVHRLDRVTTGCCIFATTTFGQQALSDAFRRRLVEKRYLALVEGRPSFKRISADARLLRRESTDHRPPARHKGAMAWQEVNDAGQRALTHIRVLSAHDDVSVVLCHPITGRMHQIRAHLAHLGHPIVGDFRYGSDRDMLGPFHVGLHALLLDVPRPGQKGRAPAFAPVPDVFSAQIDDVAKRRIREAESVFFLQSEEKAKPKVPTGQTTKSSTYDPTPRRRDTKKKGGRPSTDARANKKRPPRAAASSARAGNNATSASSKRDPASGGAAPAKHRQNKSGRKPTRAKRPKR